MSDYQLTPQLNIPYGARISPSEGSHFTYSTRDTPRLMNFKHDDIERMTDGDDIEKYIFLKLVMFSRTKGLTMMKQFLINF